MTPSTVLFPIGEAWWFYAAFIGVVGVLLVLDLKVFHKEAHAISSREAVAWTLVWAALAMLFALGLWLVLPGVLAKDPYLARLGPGADPHAVATKLTQDFLTGYVVEMSLSVDNLFVFFIIFSYFAIPARLQHRVLYWGILGAVVLRGLFIGAGSVLMQVKFVADIMGLFLVYTGVKLAAGKDEEIEPDKNPVIRMFRRFVPVTTEFHGDRFFVREARSSGKVRKVATPLFVALLVVDVFDIIFAVDSVPAIFGITNETLIVFTSNLFAILGLRTLYFLLANAVDRFHYLNYGLGVILVFVGAKMSVLHWCGVEVSSAWSLAIVLGVLAASIGVSFARPRSPTSPERD